MIFYIHLGYPKTASTFLQDKFFNNPDKNKGERDQAWLRSLKTDMHIGETVKVLSGLSSEFTKATAAVK